PPAPPTESWPAPWAKSLPPLFPRWPDYVMTTAGVPARVAGLDDAGDVPAPPALPVQWPAASAAQPQAMRSAPALAYTESSNYWGAGPKPSADPLIPYLAPVPLAPDWNDVPTRPTTSEADIFSQAQSPLSWNPPTDATDERAIDEAAAAQDARNAAATQT